MFVIYLRWNYDATSEFIYEIWKTSKGDNWVSDPGNYLTSYWIIPGTIDPMED